eukprot:jgi/Ulvmu1/4633/UM002_0364.1
MKVLELFSGVGGYHIALKNLYPGGRLNVKPYDNNQTAVRTYELNLDATVETTNIEHLQKCDVDGFDMWAMSPPCQPHTNTSMSLQRDALDQRSTPFTHICDLLECVLDPPEHIICENVPGFISSNQFRRFQEALTRRNYDWQAFLITPQMCSIPNRRPRLFVLASKPPIGPGNKLALPDMYGHLVCALPESCIKVGPKRLSEMQLLLPLSSSRMVQGVMSREMRISDQAATLVAKAVGVLWREATPLEHWMRSDNQPPDGVHECTAQQGSCPACAAALPKLPHLVDMQKALKVHRVLDVVTASSTHTNCFTKGYRKNLFGAGSIVASESFASRFCEASHDGRLIISDAGKDRLLQLISGYQSPCDKVHTHARWFTADEMAKLHGYPDWFKFPDELTERQRCALLGNGLSLHCVRPLLQHLLSTSTHVSAVHMSSSDHSESAGGSAVHEYSQSSASPDSD